MERAPTIITTPRQNSEALLRQIYVVLQQPLRLLHIDDYEGNLFLQRLRLRTYSEVAFAYEGVVDSNQALVMVSDWRPNLILTDISRPGTDGITFTRILQAYGDTCPIPVVFLTAHTDLHSQIRAYKAGAVGYFCKPSSPDIAILHELAARHRVQQVLRDFPVPNQRVIIETLLPGRHLDPLVRDEMRQYLSAFA